MLQRTRPAAVAGTFYPLGRNALAASVDAYVAAADARGDDPAPKAIIAPHAGYVYSGPIAGSAFARLRSIGDTIERVVLLGPAHRAYVSGLASPGVTTFSTPLGDVAIDVAAIAHLPHVVESEAAHAREHSLEVEVPFLQRIATRARLVPLAVGDASTEEVSDVLEALWGGPETLIVVSSDLSHYLPYATGRALDERTAARILALDPRPIDPEEACGYAGINGLLRLARAKGLRPALLDLRSSGDTAGDRDRVVGYGAFAFYAPEREARDAR